MKSPSPCSSYHAVLNGTDILRSADGKTVFKVYFIDILGRKDPSRTEWGKCGIEKKVFLQRLAAAEGMEGIGFVVVFPHITKAFRFGPEGETVLNVRGWNTRDMTPFDLARSDGYIEFACLAEAIIAADEYALWAKTDTVEAFLAQWSSFADASIARHDKLHQYWEKSIRKESPTPDIFWNIDNIKSIGGHEAIALGCPKVISTPTGKALDFNGETDGVILDVHPLAGWNKFTVEVIFRPDSGGQTEQRFFHLQENGSENRLLLETRLTKDDQWFLDTFIKSGATDQTLYAEGFKHPTGKWHNATLSFDGKRMRHYVNGNEEMSAEIEFIPPSAGRTSVGMRINNVYWFKGAIRQARFTPHALLPKEFLVP